MEESTQPKKLTTASGRPIFDNQNTQSAGARGPLLLQDYFLHEKSAHFNRERLPERVVHAKGSGAYGKFTVTHDITHLTRAKLFAQWSRSALQTERRYGEQRATRWWRGAHTLRRGVADD